MNKGKFYCSVKDFLEDNSNNTKNVFLLIAEYTNFQITDLNNYQGKSSGAIVPFVIYNNEFFNKGVIACFLEEASSIALIKDLSVFDIDNSFFKNKQSFIVLLDGLSSNITNFLDNLFENIPQNTQVMGGGAGKLTLKNDPVIFLEGKLYSNAAIIIATSFKLHTKVANGWEHLEGPFLTTNSYQNVLKTLNFKKAFDVYKDVVEQNSGMKFTDDNFFDIAKFYPLGIVKFNSEAVVRDPIYLNEDNDMVLVGDIPQNSTINILKGEKDIYCVYENPQLKDRIVFRLCSLEAPYAFPDNMESFSTTSLALYMQLPPKGKAFLYYRAMHIAAKCLVEHLGGVIKDNNNKEMTDESLEQTELLLKKYDKSDAEE